jgi:rare lipoprotein A
MDGWVRAALCGAVGIFVWSSAAFAQSGSIGFYSYAGEVIEKANTAYVSAYSEAIRPLPFGFSIWNVPVVGIASTYNPFKPGYREGGIRTASGELYDPIAWTAAIQTGLRKSFGGVRYGREYEPMFALVEVGERKAIVKINDVGPLKRGRLIDFNEQTMRYFDPTLQRGLVGNVKITPLKGHGWTAGPVSGWMS